MVEGGYFFDEGEEGGLKEGFEDIMLGREVDGMKGRMYVLIISDDDEGVDIGVVGDGVEEGGSLGVREC